MMLSSVKASSPIEAGARDGKIDSAACGVLGCFFNARTDTDELWTAPPWAVIGRSRFAVVHEIDASPNFHAAFDPGPGDDPVADRGVRISKED